MKISEIIIDWIIHTTLFEMAFSKKDAMNKARELQMNIAYHMVAVVMYSDSENVNHWCNELNSWFHKIQDFYLKGTNKPLSQYSLHKILIEEPLETVEEVDHRMKKVQKKYRDLLPITTDSKIIHKKIDTILNSVCVDIANDVFLDIRNYLE